MIEVQIVVIMLVVLALLLASGTPVGLALMAVGGLGFWCITGKLSGLSSFLPLTAYHVTTTHGFVVVPLFILLGELAAISGISSDLFDAFNKNLGRVRGGMALAVNFSCAGFGAITGSTTSSTMAMTKVALPEMRKYGYKDEISAGLIASAGTFAALVPPSVILVVYGILADQSIGRLLLAGLIPGVVTAFLYGLRIYMRRLFNPTLFPIGQTFTWKEKAQSLINTLPFLIIALMLIGGILRGLWTPTEGGGIGAVLVCCLGLFRRRMSIKDFLEIAKDSLVSSASVFMIVIGSMLFGRFLAMSGVTNAVVESIVNANLNPLVLFITLSFLYLVLGCFLEGISVLALTLPVVLPIVSSVGWDPIWFGIVLVVLIEIALVTPPIGLNLYILTAVAPDIPIETVIRSVLWFIPADLALLLLLYFVPQLALWLPNLMFQ